MTKKFLILAAAALAMRAADRKAAVDQLVQPVIDTGAAQAVVAAVVENGKAQILGYGKGPGGAAPDGSGIFEIGPVTMTFTTLALAQMVQQKTVALEDPVRKYLPANAVPAGAQGDAEIRLLDLAAEQSGLPNLPRNIHPKNPADPFADYTPQLLYEFLGTETLRLIPNAGFSYSNLGMGLLGHALSLRYGKPYEQMIVDLAAAPLGMNDTRITLSADQQKRLVEGHNPDGKPVPGWNFDVLAGAGALRSDAADLARYVAAQIDPPEKLKAAMDLTHVERQKIVNRGSVALAWLIKPDGKTYWVQGATAGSGAYVSFNTERKTGIVVLVDNGGPLGAQIGERLEHLLGGEAVEPLPLHHPITLDSKTLDEYVGAYEVLPGVRMTITRQGDDLFVQLPNQAPVRLYAEAKDKFFPRVVDATFTFERDGQGQVAVCDLHQGQRDVKGKKVQ